jgi:hypothetical protein
MGTLDRVGGSSPPLDHENNDRTISASVSSCALARSNFQTTIKKTLAHQKLKNCGEQATAAQERGTKSVFRASFPVLRARPFVPCTLK